MARVAPSERLRRELDDVLAGIDGQADPVEAIGRLGARLILQQALEDEIAEFLGRARYERTGAPVAHRNGYEPRTVVSTSGPMELERPRLRGARGLGFESQILGGHVARTYALESLVVCSFLRGLSVRDVERALRPDDAPAEGVLVAWGVTLEGRKVLLGLGLGLGSRESYEDWLDFGRDVKRSGLRPPALVVADGAPGLWKAARELWPSADEQRCTVHALRNVVAKLSERHHAELRRASGASSTRRAHPPRRAAGSRR
jgi:putative transposase